ncbi:MAG: cyclic nucleotide-binding domain-containing protein [Candidatus Sericytochromatia bacterium]|nr:cyclic nucleotide-binding domain-containing protein [Candidatus Sericytochromatia bacterium]
MSHELLVELLFEDFSESELQELLSISEPKKFLSGDFLFKEGDNSDSIYIIFSGRVEISTQKKDHDKISFPTVVNGTVLGEIAFFDGKPRTASVRAIDNLQAIIISKSSFDELEKNHTKLAIKLLKDILRVTAERLRWADKKLIDLSI